MISSSLMAFLHHLCAFTLTACIVYELIAFRKGLTLEEARRIQRVDVIYGISAGLLIVIGLLRVFYFEKGPNYYSHNLFFWAKMSAFVLVALLSAYPTVKYVKWIKFLKQNKVPEISDKEFSLIRTLLCLEIVGIAIILLSAAMMARGIGMI